MKILLTIIVTILAIGGGAISGFVAAIIWIGSAMDRHNPA